jgi:hypothetical protein
LAFGLEERLVVHEGPGGYREVQNLGVQPMDVTWKGIFWDDQAKAKAASLKALERAGNPVDVTFDDQRYSVLIKQFVPTINYLGKIAYTITVTVVRDLSGSGAKIAPPSIDTQTQTLYGNITQAKSNLDAASTNSVLQNIILSASAGTNINLLGTLLSNAGPLAGASPSDVSSILATVGSIQSSISTYLTLINAAVASVAGTIPPALQQAYTYASDINGALSVISQNARIGQAPKTVQTGGGVSLYHLASQHYGDPMLATVIKQANGLTSMFVPAGMVSTLKLPPAQRTGIA